MDLRQKLQHYRESSTRRRTPVATEVRDLPGQGEATPWGNVQTVRKQFEVDHHHGEVPVRTALRAAPAVLGNLAVDASLGSADVRRLLYVDTETTGLAGGAGTIPFLIGMAWFEGDCFNVQQLLLCRLGEEAPMLEVLAERLRWASGIVTYNGKSFDWPLLRNRFVLNRISVPEVPPHLDLLRCSRRVFRRRLERMRLVTIEEETLGFYREGDIDSALIPSTYFGFLRGAGAECLQPIIEHNVHDLVALAALLGLLAERYEAVEHGQRDDPRDRLAMAELALRNGDEDKALHFAQVAARASRRDDHTIDALMLVSRLLKRRGDFGAAVEALGEALGVAGNEHLRRAEIHLSLAKLHEHKLKDLKRALHHARHTAAAEGGVEQDRRLMRLQRRAQRC